MKLLLFVLLTFSIISAQDYKTLFQPNTTYLDRGECTLDFFGAKNNLIDHDFKEYKNISWYTVAVDPHVILPGSVVFLPQAVGIKLPDGTYHDGYFLAHQVLKNPSQEKVALYIVDNAAGNPFKKLSGKKLNLYEIRGVKAKSVQLQYQLQYRTGNEKPTYQMVASDLTELMQYGNKNYPDISQRIEYYSTRALGTPYLIFNLGEGAACNPDPDPTIDFARVDCMTLCEHMLALAISGNYQNMYTNLQKIRYKNGVIKYVMRNHYTIADWLPNNSWLLSDVTKEIGGDLTKKMTKTIDRPNFYKTNGVPEEELTNAPGKEDVTADYVPTENLLKIKEKLKGGEIVSIVTTHPAVISAHMGIIIRDRWDNLIFRHASSSEETHQVMDERFEDYVNYLSHSKTRVGMLFMRTRNDFKIP